MRVADYIIETLIKFNVNCTHIVTGRGSLFLTDAVKNNSNMQTRFFHHEQSAAFAAVSASQLSKKPNCCLISTGCSSTNTITGLLSAWQDSISCIFISGQNHLKETKRFTKVPIRTYGQQEADIISIVKPITKYASMITDAKMVKYEIEKAMHYSLEGRRGPVWLDVPLDIQNMRIDKKNLKTFYPKLKNYKPSKDQIKFVLKKLKNAKRPSVLIGSGIKLSNAEIQLKKFITKLQIPLTFTPSAPDVYGSKEKLSIGSIGSQGCSREGAFTVQNSDLLLIIGSKLNSLITGPDFKKFARDAYTIVVDIDKNEHKKKGVKIDKLIISDAKIFLEKINKSNLKLKFKNWLNKCLHWKKTFQKKLPNSINSKRIDLYELSNIFSSTIKKNSVLICDSGYIDVILPSNIKFGKNLNCLHPASQGSMGYVLPAIIGVSSSTKKNIIAVVGDGSIMMNLQELQTIKNYNIPAKIFIINNNGYGIIRRRQKNLFRNRTIGTGIEDGIVCSNFKKISKSFNFKYIKINNKNNLKKKIAQIIKQKKPIICEIDGLQNQNYIEISYAKKDNGKFVRRPIEDQQPFLERKLFRKEMIIKTIDQ